jgi:EamA domain-containing membrane protein RarD
VNPIDIAGWAGVAVVLAGCVLVAAEYRRTGRVTILVGLLAVLAVTVASDTSPWWGLIPGVLFGWHTHELGKELRKGGAR